MQYDCLFIQYAPQVRDVQGSSRSLRGSVIGQLAKLEVAFDRFGSRRSTDLWRRRRKQAAINQRLGTQTEGGINEGVDSVSGRFDLYITLCRKGGGLGALLIEGYTVDEILALPNEQLQAIVLSDEPIVFRAGSANLLGRFRVESRLLVMELAHVDGGGEGALPALASLASRYAQRENLEGIEWRIHAVHCARPNLKLRRVLERRGFAVRDVPGVGECYTLRSTVHAT